MLHDTSNDYSGQLGLALLPKFLHKMYSGTLVSGPSMVQPHESIFERSYRPITTPSYSKMHVAI